MSLQRTPPHSVCVAVGVGGSQPDLSKISNLNMDTTMNVTQRLKRKLPENCECSSDIAEIKGEMSRIGSLLEKYVSSNEQIMQTMQENINDIKNQITDIKTSNECAINALQLKVDKTVAQIDDIRSSTSNALIEQNDLKKHIKKLENSIVIGENKLKNFESDLKNMRLTPQTAPINTADQLTGQNINEKLIQELQNRQTREKNVILVGLQENKTENKGLQDETEVNKLISSIFPDTPKPTKIFRIGKYNTNKSRSIKICFDSVEPAKQVLRNKNKLPEGLKLYSDQTPMQQSYLKNIKEELKRRQANGEKEITIKYINNLPKIVQINKKN